MTQPDAQISTPSGAARRIESPGPHDSLLQALIRHQRERGGIGETAMADIAARYGTSVGEVRGVVHFYAFLDDMPGATHDLRVSDNIVDRMAGAAELMAQLARETGVGSGAAGGGPLRLSFTSCIGLSDQGPALLANGLAIPRVDAGRAAAIADHVRRGVPVTQWPRSWFEIESNVRLAGPLLDGAFPRGDALARARRIGAPAVLEELEASGLRGRGGAGFSTARKWRLCAASAGRPVVVCNADEGEPGTFKDRELIARHAERLVEGMAVCALAVGADTGLVYLRGEYRNLLDTLNDAIDRQRDAGVIGEGFDIHVHLGAGAYICGEESALIESLEGRRGIPRIRPPFPVTSGFMGRPTVVNNVETFVAAAMIALEGPHWLRAHGTDGSAGTRLLSVSGDCATPGIFEVDFGIAIAEVLERCGARDTLAVQVGGPAGALVPADRFDHCISHEDYATGGSFMVFDASRDLLEVVGNFADFFAHESCGFCTPCRVGGALLGKRLRKVRDGRASRDDIETMTRFATVMRRASHCGLGHTAPNPVMDLVEHFPALVDRNLRSTSFEPAFDLDAALEEARELTGRRDAAAYIEDGV